MSVLDKFNKKEEIVQKTIEIECEIFEKVESFGIAEIKKSSLFRWFLLRCLNMMGTTMIAYGILTNHFMRDFQSRKSKVKYVQF